MTVEELKAAGFDRSYKLTENGGFKVACSGCDATVINGHGCHEHGCSNRVRELDSVFDDPYEEG